MKTILHITQSAGGVMHFIRSLVEQTSPEYENLVICPTGTFSDTVVKELRLKVLPCPMTRNIHPVKDVKSLLQIINLMRRNEFDILHLHSSKAGMLGRIAAKILRKTQPVIYNPHGWSFHPHMNKLSFTVFAALENIASYMCDKVVCVSDSELRQALSIGIQRNKLRTIYNGVDLRRFTEGKPDKREIRDALGLPRESYIYVCNARLVYSKSSVELLNGFVKLLERYKDIHLLYVGDGPLYSELKGLVERYNLSQLVTITGWVEDVKPYLWASDAGVLLTKWEAFGLAVVEYLACGLPCVVTRIGPMSELVTDECGMFVSCLDEIVVAETLERIRKTDFKQEFIMNRAHAFDVRKMSTMYLSLYGELISKMS